MTPILFTYAHPDDEQLTAGAVAYFAASRQRVVTYYASQGEGGMTGGLCSQEDLGAYRAKELVEAASILGIQRLIPKDHGDGQLSAQITILHEEIYQLLVEEKPQLVFTLPPTGVTKHPDHIAIQQATLSAIQAYVSQGNTAELYYRVIPEYQTGIDGPITSDHLSVTKIINAMPYQHDIFRAMCAHRTQREAMSTIFPALRDDNEQLLWSNEYYCRVM